MLLKIVQAGEPVLRAAASALSKEQIALAQTQALIEWMRQTMRDAPGVGLAAPQVGVPLQIAVIEDRPEYSRDLPPELLAERERSPVDFHTLINPKIVDRSDDQVEF